MATFHQIHIHIVFSTKGRQPFISKEWKEELHKYIAGIIQNKGQKLLVINTMPDHIHILIGLRPNSLLSDLIKDIKVSSTEFIKQKGLCKYKFQWQEGYGAFSHSPSQIDGVVQYILHQEEHHRHKTFQEEVMKMLHDFEVEHNDHDLKDWFGAD